MKVYMVAGFQFRHLSLTVCMTILASLVMPVRVHAQFYNGSQLTFGKNRVQYEEFLWTYYRFDNYDIYFYLGGTELAQYTARYVDKHLEEIEDRLDASLEDKIQFILFNNLSDLKQSNIGLVSEDQYNTGGITHIIGKKVFLYYDGNHQNFDRQIRAGIAQTIMNQMMFGGSVGSQIKNSTLYMLPDWYINGLVSYISEDWNPELDNQVKEGILSGTYKRFNQLAGSEAVYAGHSFWNFIAEKYGRNTIPNIIYMTKVSKKIENGFLYILGVSYKSLIKEWLAFYQERYANADTGRTPPEGSFLGKTKAKTVYYQFKVSPDGRHVCYVTNQSGLYKVWLQDLTTGKKKKIIRGGWRLEEKTDDTYPVLAWHPSGKVLAMIIEKRGRIFMYYYSPGERSLEHVDLFQFEKVIDISYSHDGKNMVMSAVQRGQTDLFIYNPGSNSYEQVTRDPYDDLYPRFINNSKEIVFSSNRISDTLKIENKYVPVDIQPKFDLFVYQVREKSSFLRRITETPLANEIAPVEYEKNHIAYLSDENGICNRYIARFDSAISYVDTIVHYRYFSGSYPVTDFSRGIREHDVSPACGKYTQVIFHDKKFLLQLQDMPPVSDLPVLKPGPTSFMEAYYSRQSKAEAEKEDERKAQEEGTARKKGFSTVRESDVIREMQQEGKDGKIDIRNYKFDKQSYIKAGKESGDYTEIQVPLPGQKRYGEDQLPKRLNYNVEYYLDQVVTQIDFSYLNAAYQPFTGGNSPLFLNPGFNALLQVGVNDLLEDYRITGGVRLNANLVNNEYLISFANLRKRVDKELVLHRQTIEFDGINTIIRLHSHEAYYILKYPFSPVLCVKGTALYRNDMSVFLATDDQTLKEPNYYLNWASLKGELIYDDTKNLGLNLYQGTRFKLWGEYYQVVEYADENMFVVGFDIRNYQKIHRNFIWANRFATSSSFGTNKLIYYMGGVDNWLFPDFNSETPIDYEQNYAYQTLATNMRGFDQNIRNGNSFAVINSELRFPVFRYLFNRPLKSDFLNNFQVIGFGDIGTAWTGPNPFSDDNYLYTNEIYQKPLHVVVKVQKEPVVGGFGGGLRSRLLGYFVRADLAWGVEDMKVQPSVFYLSLSLDF